MLSQAVNKLDAYLGPSHALATTNDPKTRPGQKMLACTWWGKNDVRMTEEAVPAVTESRDAVVRVTASTVCGSDLHLLKGEIIDLKKGFILGHEAMGQIDELGDALKNEGFKEGDRVVIAFPIGCGYCQYCKQMLSTACENTNASSVMKRMYGQNTGGIFGYSHFVGGFGGCQAEYVRVPFANYNLLKVPDSVPDEKALYISDIVSTSYHAVYDTGCKEGETIGVWVSYHGGLGPIGLEVCQWLHRATRAHIVAFDFVPARLALASSLFSATVYNVADLERSRGSDGVVEEVLERYPGGFDRCIDCAGFRYRKTWSHAIQAAVGLETDQCEVVNEMVRCVKKFGTIGLIADYAGFTNGFNIGGVMEKGVRLIGCGQVYYAMDEKREGMMKTFLETRFSSPRAEGTPELVEHVPKDGAFA
ncbi:hypothetical protein HDU93_006123 [Gonapodya sp. JEL0774]|nr:hypothetical protein HDU93_006123 [Gonapodya sp. JEL0774]